MSFFLFPTLKGNNWNHHLPQVFQQKIFFKSILSPAKKK